MNVYLREPDFSIDCADAVARAIENWNATSLGNGSAVHFTLRCMTQEPRTALGDVTLMRGDVFTKKEKYLACSKRIACATINKLTTRS
jgi:hypothetical protein